MPFSASPKPAPSSASPSGIISAPGWAAPIPAPSPISRNSSARRSRAPNRPDFCPYYALRRYSPVIALDLPDGLLIDVTGAAHLHGGEAKLLRDLLLRM